MSRCRRLALTLFTSLLSGGISAPVSAAPTVPAPTGPYPVGRWTVDVRVDDERRVPVHVYFPAARAGDARAAYVPRLDGLRPKLDDRGAGLDAVAAPIRADAAFAPTRSRGLILFGPGMGMAVAFYTGLLADLASRGWVVVGVEHPGIALSVVDGRAVPLRKRWTQPPPGGLRDADDATRDAWWAEPAAVQLADLRAVLAWIGTRAELARSADRALAHVGHSQGFVSWACAQLPVRACVNLDGVPMLAERSAGLGIPLLTVRDGDDSPRMLAIHAAMRAPAWDALLRDGTHNSASDFDVLAARPAARDRLTAIAAALDAFLSACAPSPATCRPRWPRSPVLMVRNAGERSRSPDISGR